MAASAQNPVIRSESKSAKKKKAKAQSTDSSAPAVVAEVAPSVGVTESNNGDGSYESPYIKELYKSIRNVNKKITNASKVDNILAENPDKSLDDLVATRKINADQKAQILKKPQLQASLAQLEEQIAQYKKFDQEYKATLAAEKASLKKSSEERFAKELEEAVTTARLEAKAEAKEEQRSALLLISQFLRLAAVRRGDEEADATLDENMALEGLLSKVYGGDASAVETMVNIIEGSSDPTVSVNSETLTTTFADIKAATLAQPLPTQTEVVNEPVEKSGAVETTEYPVQSDPTIANAGLTELDAPPAAAITNGHQETYDAGIPQNSGFGDGAANAAAEANWDANNDLTTSQEWVEVPRDAAETDTGVTATPAAPSNVQSWADDQPDSPEVSSTPPANDGFHEVQRSNRGTNRGDGQRGRGGRGGGRGSFRGDGRGRGRGGQRGGARGGRRDES